jgi:hypothetical protein
MTLVSSTKSSLDNLFIQANKQDSDSVKAINFRARVCKSFLYTDVSKGETSADNHKNSISFDDCISGATYFRDFTVWNKSEIDLYWAMSDTLKNFRFTDYETGELLDLGKPIPSYSHTRVRITFKPTQPGEVHEFIQLENLNDSSNVETINLQAFVRSTNHEEVLVISSGNTLDFGECYSGLWTKQRLVLKNISESSIDVNFGAVNANVYFELLIEEPAFMNNVRNSSVDVSAEKAGSKRISTVSSSSDSSSRAESPVTTSRNVEKTLITDASKESLQSNDDVPKSSSSSVNFGLNLSRPTLQRQISSILTSNKIESKSKDLRVEAVKIEDLTLKPGIEKTVFVVYQPPLDNSPNFVTRSFRLVLSYTNTEGTLSEKKYIQGRAKCCSSVVDVSPQCVDFGDTNVGTLKSLPLMITNQSELQAFVMLKFTSKVLNCYRQKIAIPPKQSMEIKLDIYPRKVNPEYKKQITLINLLNRENDKTIDVKAVNIDKNRVTFHSLFYRLITPHSTNFIDFGPVVLNSTALRSFVVQNISSKKLVLEITTSRPDEMVAYCSIDYIAAASSSKESVESWPDVYRPNESSALDPIGNLTDHVNQATSFNSNIDGSISVEFRRKSSVLEDTDAFYARSQTTPTTPKIINPKRVRNYSGSQRERREQLIESMEEKEQAFRKTKRTIETASPSLNTLRTSGSFIKKASKTPKAAVIDTLDLAFTGVISRDASRSPLRRNLSSTNAPKSNRISFASEIRQEEDWQNPKNPAPLKLSLKPQNVKSIQLKSFDVLTQAINSDEIPSKNILPRIYEMLGVTNPDIHVLSSLFESLGNLNLLSKPTNEEKFVRLYLCLFRDLERMISSAHVEQVNRLELQPNEEKSIFVIFSPHSNSRPTIALKPKKDDTKIMFKLMEFDRQINQPIFQTLLTSDIESIPVREFSIRSSLCNSMMDLGQRNINFGMLVKGERKTKTLLIRNLSEIPLLYSIKKSGSIASGDVSIFENKMGVIRSFGKKEIDFVFDPSLAGNYQEQLLIENVLNHENDQVVTIKATVRKPSNYFLSTLSLNYGKLHYKSQNFVQTVNITNTDKTGRNFEVRVNENYLCCANCIVEIQIYVFESNQASLTKEIEEKIEVLEQKLKIAQRKGRPEKAMKIAETLESLRRGDGNVLKDDVDDKESVRDAETSTFITSTQVSPISHNAVSFASALSAVKKTPNSIVFPLEAQKSKTISIHLLVKKLESNGSKISQESIEGSIFVNEYKNTDQVKIVKWEATICYDDICQTDEKLHDSSSGADEGVKYRNSSVFSEAESRRISVSSAQIEQQAIFKYPPTLSFKTPESAVSFNNITSPEPETPSIQEQAGITLSAKSIDLGRIEIAQKISFSIYVTNIKPMEQPIDIYSDSPSFSTFDMEEFSNSNTSSSVTSIIQNMNERHSSAPLKIISIPHQVLVLANLTDLPLIIGPNETTKIDFILYSHHPGKQKYKLVFKPLEYSPVSLSLQLLSAHPKYLSFPDLKNGDLDVGTCYIDPSRKYSKMVPFPLHNISDSDIYISAESNLPTQICLFTDSVNEVVAKNVFVKSGSKTILFIALQPILVKGECRELVGGIKFHVYSHPTEISRKDDTENEMHLLLTQTVKLRGITGQSFFSVSETSIDFKHSTELEKTFRHNLVLSNLSRMLPCSFYVESSSFISVEPSYGTITSESGDQMTLEIVFVAPHYGYYEEEIVIANESNSGQIVRIPVKLFIDDCSLKCNQKGMKEECIDLYFDDIYLDPSNYFAFGKYKGVSLDVKYAQSFIKAESNRKWKEDTIYLRPRSVNAQQPFHWNHHSHKIDTNKVKPLMVTNYMAVGDNYDICGETIGLKKDNTISFTISPLEIFGLTEEQKAQLNSGNKVHWVSNLLLENMKLNAVVKVFRIHHTLCVSKGYIEPNIIDLGKIGHSSIGKSLEFNVKLQNLSECVLYAEPQTHGDVEIFTIKQVANESMPDLRVIKVPAKETRLVTLGVDPQKLPDQTSVLMELRNLKNPLESISCTLKYELTHFQLKYHRLFGHELILPPLTYPQNSKETKEVSTDVWFKIENISSEKVQFEVYAVLSPDVETLVSVELLSRQTNSPIKVVSLEAKGQIEIRVKVIMDSKGPLPGTLFSFPEAGLTFGRLCVTLLNANNEGNDFVDDILVRGSFHLGKAFGLSKSKISCCTGYFETFEITNHFASEELCVEFASLYCNYKVDLKPGETRLIETLNLSIDDSSGVDKVIIDVKETKFNQLQSLNVQWIKPEAGLIAPDAVQVESTPSGLDKLDDENQFSIVKNVNNNGSGKYLTLRGCKRVSSTGEENSWERFEIDVGQQDEANVTVTKKVTIENNENWEVGFNVRYLNSYDTDWVKISKTEGVVKANESQPIVFSFYPLFKRSYSTYVIVENKDNPNDIKLIRLQMEVVVNSNDNETFSILVDDTNPSNNVMDLGILYYNSLTCHRSFIIRNEDAIALEFYLSSPPDVVFSLSVHVPKIIQSVTIDPDSHVRVYVWVNLQPPKALRPYEDVYTRFNTYEEKEIEILINCRQVKDFQRSVFLKFTVYHEQLALSQSSVVFYAQSDGKDILIEPETAKITIKNLIPHPTRIYICNDTKYFYANQIDDVISESVELVIRPKRELIKEGETRKVRE